MKKYSNILAFIAVFIVSFSIGILYSSGKNTAPGQNKISSKYLVLERTDVNISGGISKDEENKIEDFIYSFEAERKLQNADKIINFFTPPASDQEKSGYDFILGKDIGNSPRLFSTQGFFNWVGASSIKSISKNGDNITVKLNELRTFYAGLAEPPDKIGYYTIILPVRIEVKETDQGLKIDKYYRESAKKDLKYEALSS